MSKEITGFKPGSKSWKKFMAKLYGIGGAVVIVGALFKLEHLPGSSVMLWAGLGTEAVIFFFSAFEPLHEDPDWSLVYPELAEDFDGESVNRAVGGGAGGGALSSTQELDLMLEQAKIGPDLIESLGQGMSNLANTAKEMNSLGDAASASNELVDNMKDASNKMENLTDSYAKAAESLTGLNVDGEETASYAENLKKINTNLSELNGVYELQLENSSKQMRTSDEMFNNIEQLITNLNDSVEDTKRYKENISELGTNLSALNNIYGNMLRAMNAGVSNPS